MLCYDPREGEEFKGVEKNTEAPVDTETTICNSVVAYVTLNPKKKDPKRLIIRSLKIFFCQILLK